MRAARYHLLSNGCDLHPWMRGWIYVFDNGYYTVTDAKGKFRLPGVQPGRYRLAFRQPDVGYKSEQAVVVSGKKPESVLIELGRKDLKVD